MGLYFAYWLLRKKKNQTSKSDPLDTNICRCGAAGRGTAGQNNRLQVGGQVAVANQCNQFKKGFSCAGAERTHNDSLEALLSGNARSGFQGVGFSLPWEHLVFCPGQWEGPFLCTPALAAVPDPVPTDAADRAACSQAPYIHPIACVPCSWQLRAVGHGWILGCGSAWLWLLLLAMKLSPKPLTEKQK